MKKRNALQRAKNRETVRKYQERNREKVKEYRHAFYQTHKEEARAHQRKWVKINKKHVLERARLNYAKNRALRAANRLRVREARRAEIIKEYGGKCACCGEDRWEFMTMDHIGGRKKHGHSKAMAGFYLQGWLKRNGFPKKGFRLLCFNCNCSHGFRGYCPHERERQAQAAD